MTLSKQHVKSHTPLIGLFLITLVSHGSLFLMDAIFIDGWWINDWLNKGDWESIQYLAITNGLFFQSYFFGLLMLFPDPNIAGKFLTFLFLYLTSIISFCLFDKNGFFSRAEAFGIAALIVTIPAVRVYGNTIPMVTYSGCVFLFLFSCFVFLRLQSASAFLRPPLRIVAIFGFIVSFTMGSLLVFFLGFFVGLFILDTEGKNRYCWKFVSTWLVRHLDLIILPFAFWTWRRTFFPGVDKNIDYQVPSLGFLDNIPHHLYHLFGNELPRVILRPLSDIFAAPVLGLLIVATASVGALLLTRLQARRMPFRTDTPVLPLFLFSTFLLFLAVIPYWATGRELQADGFGSRLAILLPIPIALFLVGLVRLYHRSDASKNPMWGTFFLVILFQLSFCVVNAKTYLNWQLVGIKDKAVIADLKKLEGIANFTMIKVEDSFVIRPLYEQSWNRWPYIVAYATGNYERHAYGSRESGRLFVYPSDDNLRKIIKTDGADPPWRAKSLQNAMLSGPKATLSVEPGEFFTRFQELSERLDPRLTGAFHVSRRDQAKLIFNYFWLKSTDQDQFETFLDSLVRLNLVPTS